MKANLIRWLRPEEKTKDEILEIFVMEQLLTTLSLNLRSWVQRNRPKRLEETIHLIEDYCMAEEGTREHAGMSAEMGRPHDKMATGSSSTPRGPATFSAISRGKPPVFEPVCPKPVRPITYDHRLFEPGTGLKEGKDGKPVCFDCGRPGHVKRECPGLDCSWGEGEEAKDEERTAHCSGGACEGTDKKSEPSAKDKMEKKEKRGEHQGVIGSDNRTEEKVTVEEKAGKWEICLAEGEWEEQEGSVWQEDKSEEGVVWFDTVVERYERRKKEERRRAFEKVRDQGLLKDFPNLRIGGLLPNPAAGEGELKRMVAQEWSVIVTLQEAELRREWEKSAASFPEGPDERGWVRHSCCGTICAMRSAPPPRSEVKERRGMFRQ
ncbi:RIB43A-like with coiled-coils protein 2 isoform X3 [Pogona vitticeps]